MSELDHFVVYKLPPKPVFISVMLKSVGISSGAYDLLGCPEYVNVFFDECGRRVMIRKSDQTMPNALKVISHQGGKNRTLCNSQLTKKVRAMLTTGTRMEGHGAGEGTVIFEAKG